MNANTTVKTFSEYDLLGLDSFGKSLKKHLIAEYPYTDGSLVVSLNGRFGCGKSSFLEMFKHQLEQEQHEVIYVNAWQNDFFDEPVVTLLSELIAYIEQKKGVSSKITEGLKKALLSIVGGTAIVTNQVLRHTTGIDIREVDELTEKEIENRDIANGNAIFKEYLEKKSLFDKLNEALAKYISEIEKKPLFIFIDELDRTRPDYAVSFIETLKHFFKTNGIIFLLAVDKQHLSASVKALYGSEISFPEYYRKFVHRNAHFPGFALGSVEGYIQERVQQHFDSNESRFFVTKLDQSQQKNISRLCRAFSLSPRQMDELFRILSHFLSDNKSDKVGIFGSVLASMIYTSVSLSREELCQEIIFGSFNYLNWLKLIDEIGLINREKSYGGDWWAMMLIYITSTEDSYNDNIKAFIKAMDPNLKEYDDGYKVRFEYVKETSSQVIGAFGAKTLGNMSIMQETAVKINECKTFFE